LQAVSDAFTQKPRNFVILNAAQESPVMDIWKAGCVASTSDILQLPTTVENI